MAPLPHPDTVLVLSHIYITGLHLGNLCPPQPVSLLGHAPPLLIGSGYFQAKPFPIKIPQQSHPGYSFCLHCLYKWNRQGVPKHRHIKFRCWGIIQKNNTTIRKWPNFEIKNTLYTYIYIYIYIYIHTVKPALNGPFIKRNLS